jgi:hemerythrin-like domain-containing protein
MTTNSPPSLPNSRDSAPRPDLSNYRQIHRALRVSAERLVVGLSSVAIGDVRRCNGIARWFAGYGAELTHHHHLEDTIFFPALAERVPAHGECSTPLDDDHATLETLIPRLADALTKLKGGGTGWIDHREQALAMAIELRDLLTDHLAFEDADVLPMFERHFTVEEYDEIDKRALKEVNVRQALFTVPWYMATAEPSAAARTLAEAPLPLKIVHRITRRRYARLVQQAFGGAS